MEERYFLYQVGSGEEDRLDRFLMRRIKDDFVSRQMVIEMIKDGKCMVNSKVCIKPSIKLKKGDVVQFFFKSPCKNLSPVYKELDILWGDQDLLVINKPHGLSVHPVALKEKEDTLVNRLISKFPELKEMDRLRPGIVHRLDKDTSGLMVIALNKIAQKKLIRSFAKRKVVKEYVAVIYKTPEFLSSEISKPIARSVKDRKRMTVDWQGKEAKTRYEVIYRFKEKDCSLVKVGLLTGRTHQIRVHFSSIHHPVLGDEVYGKKEWIEFKDKHKRAGLLIKRQLLHSWKLIFPHPRTGEEKGFIQPVPKDFYRALLYLFKRVQRVGITGGVGCGKSLLVSFLKDMGAEVWSADGEVKRLYRPEMPGWEAITHFWGDRFFKKDSKEIDKTKIFEQMVKTPDFRKELETIIHPMVERGLEDFFLKNFHKRIAVAEVPLLIEVGWKKKSLFDVVVGVYCKDELRYKWLMEKRGLDINTINVLDSWQMKQEEKMKNVDLVVINPGNMDGFKEVAKTLWGVLKQLRKKRLRSFLNFLIESNLIDS